MIDPSMLIRTPDNKLRPAGEFVKGDQFFDSDGELQTLYDVITMPSVRYYLEAIDGRSLIVSEKQPWITWSIVGRLRYDGTGEKVYQIIPSTSLPFREPGQRQNLAWSISTLDVPYVNPNNQLRAPPEVRAMAECMGTNIFLDIKGEWRDRIAKLTRVKTFKRDPYWYEFETQFPWEPFKIHEEVFEAPVEYRERYLAGVYYICGEYRPFSLAYLAHTRPDYLEQIKRLVWSLGGITPPPNRPMRFLIQKSINRLGYNYEYLRIQTAGINNYVPGNFFRGGKTFTFGMRKIEKLEDGPMVALIPERNAYCLTEEYFPIYCPSWKDPECEIQPQS